ncbi:prolipoprotein diacylglyceryl transferase [Persicobacter sp. CCB-QB2]|nr:prolipoprotein diacylglyceryl transferase [Persicobacter sp. CCB-QB2]
MGYILWYPSPEIFPGLSDVPVLGHIRWYGLLFALGFVVMQQVMIYIFKMEKRPLKDIESLTVHAVLGTIIGARLGHVLFYEPQNYLPQPWKIFMIWEGGLASHGATIGILVAIWIYARKRKDQPFFWVIDRIALVVGIGAFCIRTGNLMNSEIIGLPTDSQQGVVFAHDPQRALERYQGIEEVSFSKGSSEEMAAAPQDKVPVDMHITFAKGLDEQAVRKFTEKDLKYMLTKYDYVAEHMYQDPAAPMQYRLKQEGGLWTADVKVLGIPRHAGQEYEGISSLLLFFGLFFYWKKRNVNIPNGQILGIFLTILFSLRFIYEFFKENQVPFEDTLPLNMGQWLSVPFILMGLAIWLLANKKKGLRLPGE